VQRRSDDVRRLLVGHLQNEFGQVGFGDGDARCFQRVVQLDLFRSDALALHYQLGFVAQQDVANVLVGVGRRLRQIEMPAVGAHAGFELPQQLRQIGDGVFLDLAGAVLEFVVVGEQRGGGVAIAVEGLGVAADGRALHAQRHADGIQQSFLVALVGHLARIDVGGIHRSSHAHLNTMMCSLCGP
jgi:hypothetical protein